MKRERHILVFITTIIIISIITGYIYGINNNYDIANYLNSLINHNNQYINDLIITFVFLFCTISLIGIIINIFIISIESISIGYILAIFYKHYSLKGILYAIISISINRLIFILILIYLFYTCYNYVKKNINNILGINNDYIKNILIPLLKKYTIILIFIVIYDTLIYFFGNMFLNYIQFML